MPCVTVTAAPDCLVNHSAFLKFYGDTLPYIEIIPTYEGASDNLLLYWQIYDENGNPYARISAGDSYVISEKGEYTVVPVFK